MRRMNLSTRRIPWKHLRVAAWLRSSRQFVFVGGDGGTTLRRLDYGQMLMLSLRRFTRRRIHLCRAHMAEGRLYGREKLGG